MDKVVQPHPLPSQIIPPAFPLDQEEISQLQKLKDRILHTQAELPLDDPFLLKYLRYNKEGRDDPDSTIAMMTAHIKSLSEILPLPSQLKKSITNSRVYVPLRKPDRNGVQVMVLRIREWNPSQLPLADMIATSFYVDDHILSKQGTQVNGIVIISDWSGCSWRHLTHLTSHSVAMMRAANAMPMKLKGYHFVHGGSVANMLIKLINPFLKPKIRSRIVVHGSDFSLLHTHIPPSTLPLEYGGLLSQTESEDQDYAANILRKEDFYRNLFHRKMNADPFE